MSEQSEKKPTLAVHKFASCDGCQLSILALEDDLLELGEHISFHHFPEASSELGEPPFDISLVEGSITTNHDKKRIEWIRENSQFVISIGACATHGGIQALKNFSKKEEFINLVYAEAQYIDTLDTSTAIAHHIPVDFELQGCPINKMQLKEVILAFAVGRRPLISRHSVCMDCKMRGTVCVMVTKNLACLGPITHTGCGAICPAYGRACYGCFGPSTPAHTDSFFAWLQKEQHKNDELSRTVHHINCGSPTLHKAQKDLSPHES